MKIVDAAATHAALPMDTLVDALARAFADGCQVPPRHVHEIGTAPGAMTSLIMPAWTPDGWYGVKLINIAPGNAARGLPGLHATYVLHEAGTGVPVAILDGNAITQRRTAAASALAARWLARDDSRHLLVVGGGRIAALLPQAYRAVRPIERVTVWTRDPAQGRALVEQWRTEGFDAQASADLSVACSQADIVSCATLATEPVVHGTWLRPGTHLDLIGSFTPAMREADDDCFADAGLWIDTDEALIKSGELLGPMSRGVFAAGDVRGTLAQLSRGQAIGRRDARERTVFKSVGTALEDLAAASLAWRTLGAAPA